MKNYCKLKHLKQLKVVKSIKLIFLKMLSQVFQHNYFEMAGITGFLLCQVPDFFV